MRRRTLILWFNWFVDNLIFYGFLFYISDLRGSPYLNMVYMYVVSDVPGIFLAWIAIQKFGRRVPYCVFMITGGVACLLVLAVPKDQTQITTVLAFIGRGLVTMSFSIMYLYSSELYPTSMRNLAVGVCSTVARLGSIIAPYIVMLSQLPGLSVTLPMVIFGVLAVTAGLTILWLPETLNSNMCQTLEETNLAKEYYGFIWMEKHVMNPFSFLRWSSSNEDSSLDVPVPSNEAHYYADADCEEFSVENTPLMSNTKES
ncbi:hypothetical protein OS493_015968 [Desmophyllum pertusum]|uniref:Major facilitator superfamily (MFS) profile domain-containing protein n=1 Tax=Desmophyllum pertusum TaxID=174260 RepID=A0A9W9YCT0_9CNID|nr:hypothetical protein OS493_015968 [Desmophyllum pertusum]